MIADSCGYEIRIASQLGNTSCPNQLIVRAKPQRLDLLDKFPAFLFIYVHSSKQAAAAKFVCLSDSRGYAVHNLVAFTSLRGRNTTNY